MKAKPITLLEAARSLDDALGRTKARGAIAEGRLEPFAAEEVDAIGSELPLSEGLRDFYRIAGPRSVMFPAEVEDVRLYGLDDLVACQEGYRWCVATKEARRRFPNAEQIERTSAHARVWLVSPDWDPTWVVIGDIGADPIIADTSLAHTPIYFARRGMGRWRVEPAAPSPVALLRALDVWAR